MRRHLFAVALLSAAVLIAPRSAPADEGLLEAHCADCHTGDTPEGDFDLRVLGDRPAAGNADFWANSLRYVTAGEMPPPGYGRLSDADRAAVTDFLDAGLRDYDAARGVSREPGPRRLNNRELVNSLRDVLRLEHVGTHRPAADLPGDALHHGFDTNGDALGLSRFHLEQSIGVFRKVLDATLLTGPRPPTQFYRITPDDLRVGDHRPGAGGERAGRTADGVDLRDPAQRVTFANFPAAPATGRYRIRVRAAGLDRGLYDAAATGIHPGDPIRLRVHLGGREFDFDLPDGPPADGQPAVIAVDAWLAAGTPVELSNPTDGLRLEGNGNFKFQFRIAHDHIQRHDPELYARVVREVVPRARTRRDVPGHWIHWVDYWRGPRPRVYGVEVEGPLYESWPPRRQVALLGEDPRAENAAEILRPIAERAWRREVRDGELDPIVRLVRRHAAEADDPASADVAALKEGIVAVLASPAFLLVGGDDGDPADRFAAKLARFLGGTIPDRRLRDAARDGRLGTFAEVRAEVRRRFASGEADEFLREFPRAWLELDRINFMAPDPVRFPLYDRKRLGEDMVGEVRHLFRHAVERNRPLPELLAGDSSFLNADLARVYGVGGVPQDSVFREHTFTDGRRGGLLGTGAFLTLTADSLGTSPIHRAVYVMENFLGLHPSPPPADVEVTEPDVRQAKTIREVLDLHRSDPRCAACHRGIDPWGYAFENFDSVGAWREEYTAHIPDRPSRRELLEIAEEDHRRAAAGLPPVPRPWEATPLPVESSARFRGGEGYGEITEFRRLLRTDRNRDRFVRCFIGKLLTYADGVPPADPAGVERILAVSAAHDHRIVDTIAAVVHSPLFRP